MNIDKVCETNIIHISFFWVFGLKTMVLCDFNCAILLAGFVPQQNSIIVITLGP